MSVKSLEKPTGPVSFRFRSIKQVEPISVNSQSTDGEALLSPLFDSRQTSVGQVKDKHVAWQVSTVLHKDADIVSLLKGFSNLVTEKLAVDGIEYGNKKVQTYFIEGLLDTHRCHFSLHYLDNDCGELVVSRRKRFDEKEIKHLESLIAGLMAPLFSALGKRRAVLSKITDPLTGLFLPGSLNDRLAKELQRMRQYDIRFCTGILEINDLAGIEEQQGSLVARNLIEHVAHCLQKSVRVCDAVVRYQPAQFVVVLPELSAEQAVTVLERLKQICLEQAKPVRTIGHFRLSSGVVESEPHDAPERISQRLAKTLSDDKAGEARPTEVTTTSVTANIRNEKKRHANWLAAFTMQASCGGKHS